MLFLISSAAEAQLLKANLTLTDEDIEASIAARRARIDLYWRWNKVEKSKCL
jgi:hypothetical protein